MTTRFSMAFSLLLAVGCATTDGETGSESMTASSTTSTTSTGGGTSESGDTGGTETSGDGDTGGAVTWDNGMADFFEVYCWNCHGPGDPENRDYSLYEHVMRDASPIRCGTAETTAPGCGPGDPSAQQFPIADPRPSADERNGVVAWIDAGLP
jgi:hypothetical protein